MCVFDLTVSFDGGVVNVGSKESEQPVGAVCDRIDYEAPSVTYLGKLGTLIQGVSGSRRDNFPMTGSQP